MVSTGAEKSAWALPAETPTRDLLDKVRRRSIMQAPPLPSGSNVNLVAERPSRVEQVAANDLKNGMKLTTGLTWEAAQKLESEFDAQEMILKGLQRDNEAKTIEVEQLRRQMRTISEFLSRQYGSDWETVVFGSDAGANSSARRAHRGINGSNEAAIHSPSRIARVLAGPKSDPAPSSPLKRGMYPDDASLWASESSFVSARGNRSPTKAHMPGEDEPEASVIVDEGDKETNAVGAATRSNNRSDLGAVRSDTEIVEYDQHCRDAGDGKSRAGPATGNSAEPTQKSVQNLTTMFNNANIGSQNTSEPATSISQDQARAILDQLSAARMLIQGFARRNAQRDEELRQMQHNAAEQAVKGRQLLDASVGTLSDG